MEFFVHQSVLNMFFYFSDCNDRIMQGFSCVNKYKKVK